MFDFIVTLDQQVFLFLNGLHCAWLDPVMLFASGRWSWALLYAGMFFFFFWKRTWTAGLFALLAVALAFALTDQLGGLIKHAVQRPRPCLEFEGLLYSLEACGGRFASFVSNHAANIFGSATISALIFRKKYYTVGIYAWSALVAYSRIYVGKHYPLDLLGGALLGIAIGYLVFLLYNFCISFLHKRNTKKICKDTGIPRQSGQPANRQIGKIIYSLCYYLYFIIASPVIFFIGGVLLLLTGLFDRDRKILHYYSYFWGLQYYWIAPWWHLQVNGLENVAPKKKYIILSNHQSMIDICLLYKIPKPFKWISKKEVLRLPFVGWALWLHRDVLISRDRTGLKKMMKEAQDYLSRNVSIILFPEGTRSIDGQMHDFKEGGFLLARTAKTAILPVVIDGTFDVLHKNSWLVRRKQTFRINILPEIPEEEVAATATKEMMHKLHALMRNTHQQMAPEKYPTQK
ncbi:MAG: 1-acyl-sn-glycerol-3-phosphate acyltransferase [Prevotellaceae bacterium]|jgi:1-acyl-sn-glycerol-3-phosphate acyltransferase|nr:1-acyl-sn-glycerol-3-phosphate acyltransferase [Prevotellaceae bacterium]